MSSMRNAVQRRNHRERAQPTERSKWGLLEKRKDYKLRAADHKSKQAKLSALKSKASERNEDEFYFGMMRGNSEKSRFGRAEGSGGGKSLDQDIVALMKTQDVGYLRTMLQRVRKERERVDKDVVAGEVGVETLPGVVSKGKVVFGEDGEVVEEVREDEDEGMFDMSMDMDDLEGLDGEDGGIEEDDSEDEDEDSTPEEREAKRKKRHALDVKRRKLEALKDQEDKLSAALAEVEHQRAKMNGSIGGVNKKGVKFKQRQRKR